ncbi:ATP-binding cassette sub-family B member 8, mitochondrial [Eumeta japonica]|uniref:Mitochondrial potassium channel ATP-binding subunit n=1 Tax=Eumeta variegata TaxID=151549 RepID=A0A4C1TZC5_EUMVA|nr:ATP-binding cassette sub-family B member 8, mitochondrial [Eumeta japonica]
MIRNGPIYCKGLPPEEENLKKDARSDIDKFDYKKFLNYLYCHKLLLIAAIAASFAVAMFNIYIPTTLGALVNLLISAKGASTSEFFKAVKGPATSLFGLYVGQAVCTFLYIHFLAQIGERVAAHMKNDLFAAILRQDIAFFDKQRTGELLNRLTIDVQDFKSAFKQVISGGLRATIQMFGSAGTLLVISPKLTSVLMLFMSSVIIGGTYVGFLLRTLSMQAQAQAEKATLVAEDALANIRTVRAFVGEPLEEQKFCKEVAQSAELNMELGFGIALFQAGTNLFLNSMILGTLFLGGQMMFTGKMTAGDVMAFLVSAQMIQRSMATVSMLFGSVIKGLCAGGRVFEYINKSPEMNTDCKHVIEKCLFRGDVEFRNVVFSYPTRPEIEVLKKISLCIPAGKTIAVVGTSGDGKSTLVSLLERFYDVDCGAVLVDGYDIRMLDIDWLRSKVIGLITQEPSLFATTILENIRYGKPDATDEEVCRAAKIANVHNFVMGFPDGYHTMVGERGVTLSGGQKQRIAIARAILKNPPILVLDEATSALDSQSEKIVQDSIDYLSEGRTVLIIAHRLSTISNADFIVVLHKGRIVEMGTHEQLKSLKGFYWNLFRAQQHDD